MRTEQTKAEKLRELVAETGPCITIALPAGTGGTQWKNAMGEIREELRRRNADVEGLLGPVEKARAEHSSNGRGQQGGLVILRSPSVLQVRGMAPVTPLVRVDDHFDLRVLLSLLHFTESSFYLLALSQNRTRILKCTRQGSEEIPYPAGFPTSLSEAMQTRKPDHTLDNRASGGPSMGGGAVMFGTSTDGDDKDEYLAHFFADIDRAVAVALKGSSDPLIPVGVEHEIALYRRANTYPHLVAAGVHGAPDGLHGGDMHRRAIELLDSLAADPKSEGLEDFDKRVGTGRASTQMQEIVTAAYAGRVSHFFFQENARYSGVFDPVRARVKHTEDPLDSPVDLVEAAAVQTLLQGGEVEMLPGAAMPNGVPVCALFRYPLVQTAGSEPLEPASVE